MDENTFEQSIHSNQPNQPNQPKKTITVDTLGKLVHGILPVPDDIQRTINDICTEFDASLARGDDPSARLAMIQRHIARAAANYEYVLYHSSCNSFINLF